MPPYPVTTLGQASCSLHLQPGADETEVSLPAASTKETLPSPAAPPPQSPGTPAHRLNCQWLSPLTLLPSSPSPCSRQPSHLCPPPPHPAAPGSWLLHHQVLCHPGLFFHGCISAYTTVHTAAILNPLFGSCLSSAHYSFSSPRLCFLKELSLPSPQIS